MLLRLLAPLTVAAFTLFATAAMGAGEPQLRMPVRIVDVRGATALVSRGAAVLDARDAAAFAQGHIPGAQLYAWQSFTGEGARAGACTTTSRASRGALGPGRRHRPPGVGVRRDGAGLGRRGPRGVAAGAAGSPRRRGARRRLLGVARRGSAGGHGHGAGATWRVRGARAAGVPREPRRRAARAARWSTCAPRRSSRARRPSARPAAGTSRAPGTSTGAPCSTRAGGRVARATDPRAARRGRRPRGRDRHGVQLRRAQRLRGHRAVGPRVPARAELRRLHGGVVR